MEMTTVKTIAVFAIIFGCFAVLYPKIFHPMLANLFGGGRRDDHSDHVSTNRIPPHLRKSGPTHKMPGGGGADEEISKFMRAGPHPGMRAAAEMKKQAATQGGGSGKGMMSVVLPMYAVGIVVYLIYTMVKVFGGKKDKEKGDFLNNHFNEIHYDAETKKFRHRTADALAGRLAEDQEEEEEDEEETIAKKFKKGRRDLERLLLKADKNNINSLEMHELKRRLLETEAQMARILGALESVEGQVGAAGSAGVRAAQARRTGDGQGEDGEWEDEEQPQEDNKRGEAMEKASRTVDSSPDMDSYEIISSKASPNSTSQSQSPTIEDIGPKCNAGYDADSRQNSDLHDDIPLKHAKCKEDDGDDDIDNDDEVTEELMPEKKLSDDEEDSRHPDLRKRTTASLPSKDEE